MLGRVMVDLVRHRRITWEFSVSSKLERIEMLRLRYLPEYQYIAICTRIPANLRWIVFPEPGLWHVVPKPQHRNHSTTLCIRCSRISVHYHFGKVLIDQWCHLWCCGYMPDCSDRLHVLSHHLSAIVMLWLPARLQWSAACIISSFMRNLKGYIRCQIAWEQRWLYCNHKMNNRCTPDEIRL